MRLIKNTASISRHELKEDFKYKNIVVLTLSMVYPRVSILSNRMAGKRINETIRLQTAGFYDYAAKTLYGQAVRYYQDTQSSGFPFHPYDAVLHYDVTYNENCYLSSYHDQYEYTGGAHGNTVRASDTWSLKTGARLELADFFSGGQNYKSIMLASILKQADQDMRENPGVYFDTYRALIIKYFNEESYYLTPEGLAIYFQQYEIAPYASGIVVFVIPYAVLGWRPSCL